MINLHSPYGCWDIEAIWYPTCTAFSAESCDDLSVHDASSLRLIVCPTCTDVQKVRSKGTRVACVVESRNKTRPY